MKRLSFSVVQEDEDLLEKISGKLRYSSFLLELRDEKALVFLHLSWVSEDCLQLIPLSEPPKTVHIFRFLAHFQYFSFN